MATTIASRLGVKFSKLPSWGLLSLNMQPTVSLELVRHRRTKHFDPKWKRLRHEKLMKIELIDFNEKVEDLSEEEMRSKLKKQGILPPRPWIERSFYISSTGGVFEPYVPPEGDGKMSVISAGGAKQKIQFLEKKSKSMMAIRKVRSFDEDFEPKEFVNEAQDIYLKAHTLMMEKEKLKLREIITERCYPEMFHNVRDKTIHWKFLQSLEPPRVVHARCTNVITKENIFAQVTVRFHTQQQLAIYDRFGRLMHGSEIIAKDVLEYVVFEKHLSNLYGVWRMHDKIIPDWTAPREPSPKTYEIPKERVDVGLSKTAIDKESGIVKQETTEGEKPALATA